MSALRKDKLSPIVREEGGSGRFDVSVHVKIRSVG